MNVHPNIKKVEIIQINNLIAKTYSVIENCFEHVDIQNQILNLKKDALTIEKNFYTYLLSEYKSIRKDKKAIVLRWYDKKLTDRNREKIIESKFSYFMDDDKHLEKLKYDIKEIKIFREFLRNIYKFSNDYKKELNKPDEDYVKDFFYTKFNEVFGDKIFYDNYIYYKEFAKNINILYDTFKLLRLKIVAKENYVIYSRKNKPSDFDFPHYGELIYVMEFVKLIESFTLKLKYLKYEKTSLKKDIHEAIIEYEIKRLQDIIEIEKRFSIDVSKYTDNYIDDIYRATLLHEVLDELKKIQY